MKDNSRFASYLLMILVSFLLSGCTNTDQQELTSIAYDAIELPEVELIKSMEMDNGILLGDLFDSGLSSTTYELYDPADDGNTYVTIKGNATYNNQGIIITVQYKKMENDNYEFHTMAYNDIVQNEFEAISFFEYLYDQYEIK